MTQRSLKKGQNPSSWPSSLLLLCIRPCSGLILFSIQPAEAGRLVFLAAGDEALFVDAAAALAAMGTKSFYLGPAGAGEAYKRVCVCARVRVCVCVRARVCACVCPRPSRRW